MFYTNHYVAQASFTRVFLQDYPLSLLLLCKLRGKRRNLSLGLHKRKQKFILGFPYKGEHQAN